MIGMRKFWAAGVALAAGLMAISQACAQGGELPEIQPFKAVYNLSFTPTNTETSYTLGGSGRLTIEFKGSRCTEYQMTRSVSNNLTTREGPLKMRVETRYTENPAGTRLAFSIKEQNNDKVLRQETLLATRDAGGVITLASRALPGGKATLPADIVFPLRHDRDVMVASGRAQKNFTAKVYLPDLATTAVEQMAYTFGPDVTSALPKGHPADIEPLKNQPRYRVEVVSRDPKTGKQRAREKMTSYRNPPIQTVSNSVMEHLIIKASLGSLTMLPETPCP